MPTFIKGRYEARFGESQDDIKAAQALRYRCFRGGDGLDEDHYDAACRHVLIEDRETGALVGCFRLMPLENGSRIGDSYSAQYYELSALRTYNAPMIEMGRFCIAPDAQDGADILRVAWGAMTRYVDREGVGMLFGCSSFQGTDAAQYFDAFAKTLVAAGQSSQRVSFCPTAAAKARCQTGLARDAAAVAHLSFDGGLGVRPRGGGS